MDFNSPEPKPEQRELKASPALKFIVFALLGILLIAGILLPIKIVPGAFSSIVSNITSVFIPKETIRLGINKSPVASGDSATLNWNGKHKTNGTYTLFYSCIAGITLETSINQPSEVIPCNTYFYFSPSANSIDIVARSSSSENTDVKIMLGFLENNASTIEKLSDVTITITGTPTTAVATTTPATPRTTTTVTHRDPIVVTPRATTPVAANTEYYYPITNAYGIADLQIKIVAIGRADAYGNFIPAYSPYITGNEDYAVRFQITNIGDRATGTWNFTADLPSNTDPRYTSPTQSGLYPGSSVEYMLRFRNLTGNNPTALISVDPSNYVAEYTKANNTASVNFSEIIRGTGGTYNYGTYNQYGQPDFTVRIVGTGIINRSSNQFYETSTINSSDRAAIRFEVTNAGSRSTGSWRFRANLPSTDSSSSNYVSDSQQGLEPGQKATFTIGFDNIQYSGWNTATIYIDSSNDVNEYNENNNSVSTTINRY